MILIGITGPIGHGKSTLAHALLEIEPRSIHMESSMLISEIANEWIKQLPDEIFDEKATVETLNPWIDTLAEIVSQNITQVDANQLRFPSDVLEKAPDEVEKLFMYLDLIHQGMIERRTLITEANKDKHRAILQWLGAYMVKKIGKGFWYEEIERRIHIAHQRGCHLYLIGGLRFPYDAEVIQRNKGVVLELRRTDVVERDMSDITESERTKIPYDAKVINNAGIDELHRLVPVLYEDVKHHTLKKKYHTSDYNKKVDPNHKKKTS